MISFKPSPLSRVLSSNPGNFGDYTISHNRSKYSLFSEITDTLCFLDKSKESQPLSIILKEHEEIR